MDPQLEQEAALEPGVYKPGYEVAAEQILQIIAEQGLAPETGCRP